MADCWPGPRSGRVAGRVVRGAETDDPDPGGGGEGERGEADERFPWAPDLEISDFVYTGGVKATRVFGGEGRGGRNEGGGKETKGGGCMVPA